MNFILSCSYCDSNFVTSVVLDGISAGMNSPIGRNVAHCSAHFNFSSGCFGVSKLSSCKCLEICNNHTDTQLVARANVLREVLMIRDGRLLELKFSSNLGR